MKTLVLAVVLLSTCGFTCRSCDTYEYNFLLTVQNHQQDRHDMRVKIIGAGHEDIEFIRAYNADWGPEEIWFDVPDNKHGVADVSFIVTDLITGKSSTHRWRVNSGNRLNNAEIIRYDKVNFR